MLFLPVGPEDVVLSLWGYFTVLFPSCHREGQGQPTLWTKSLRGLIETSMLGSETEESAHFQSQHLTELKQQQRRTAYKYSVLYSITAVPWMC